MRDAKSSDRMKSRYPNSQRSFVPILLIQNLSPFPKYPPLTTQQSSKQLFSSPSILKHAEYGITKLLFCPSTRDFTLQRTFHLLHIHRLKRKTASSPSFLHSCFPLILQIINSELLLKICATKNHTCLPADLNIRPVFIFVFNMCIYLCIQEVIDNIQSVWLTINGRNNQGMELN